MKYHDDITNSNRQKKFASRNYNFVIFFNFTFFIIFSNSKNRYEKNIILHQSATNKHFCIKKNGKRVKPYLCLDLKFEDYLLFNPETIEFKIPWLGVNLRINLSKLMILISIRPELN